MDDIEARIQRSITRLAKLYELEAPKLVLQDEAEILLKGIRKAIMGESRFVKPKDVNIDLGEFKIINGRTSINGRESACQSVVLELDWTSGLVRVTTKFIPLAQE